ncbi:hypothetical protein K438DRAFT_1787918 [Mycena galopus ATCC 62051]|nr:hypothetical protein K438DRAFT_1787918 [Mycena galopus ATCC 62051]
MCFLQAITKFPFLVNKPSPKRSVVRYARRDRKEGNNEGLSSPFHSGANFNVDLDITRKKGDEPASSMGMTARTVERKPWSRRSAKSVDMNDVRKRNMSDRDGHGVGMFDNDTLRVTKARDETRKPRGWLDVVPHTKQRRERGLDTGMRERSCSISGELAASTAETRCTRDAVKLGSEVYMCRGAKW